MAKQLMKDLGEGWNAEQNQLFNQMTSKNNPPEEEYQNNIRQKLKEVQDKAGASTQQQTDSEENKDSNADISTLQNQANETSKKVEEVLTTVKDQTDQLQAKQTENDQLAEKINQEKNIIDQVNAALSQSSSGTDQGAPADENQNLAGAVNDIENS